MENPSEAVSVAIVLSDYVIQDARSGKLSLIGCFSGFHFASFPSASPPFFVTAAVTNLSQAPGRLFLTVNIKERASDLVIASASIELHRREGTPLPNRDDVIEIFLPFKPVPFPHEGVYEVEVVLNKESLGNRVVMVKLLPQGAKPPDGAA
jgi:hypothetical protein